MTRILKASALQCTSEKKAFTIDLSVPNLIDILSGL